MKREEAIDRNLARDPVRAHAYNSAVEHTNPRAYLMLSEHFLPLLHEAVRKFYARCLGPLATSDREELLKVLKEELNDHQRIDLTTLEELDTLYVKEFWEATE